MTADWDGKIRMDPSSPYAMQRLIDLRDRFEIAFVCDTDHDRNGIVTRGAGLLPPYHYLAVAIFYLFQHRPKWCNEAAVGKTLGGHLSPDQVLCTNLAGERMQSVLSRASGNGAPIGGLKVMAENSWIATRPSGTESVYKIYAESFRGAEHLCRILEEAQGIVSDALAPAR
jgi:phosphoglucomutase